MVGYETDWQALVDAVEYAADIAYPRLFTRGRWMVNNHPWLPPRVVAQKVADFYANSWLREYVDAELFALEYELSK